MESQPDSGGTPVGNLPDDTLQSTSPATHAPYVNPQSRIPTTYADVRPQSRIPTTHAADGGGAGRQADRPAMFEGVSPETSISDLPDDILRKIFTCVGDARDLARSMTVCKSFRSPASSVSSLSLSIPLLLPGYDSKISTIVDRLRAFPRCTSARVTLSTPKAEGDESLRRCLRYAEVGSAVDKFMFLAARTGDNGLFLGQAHSAVAQTPSARPGLRRQASLPERIMDMGTESEQSGQHGPSSSSSSQGSQRGGSPGVYLPLKHVMGPTDNSLRMMMPVIVFAIIRGFDDLLQVLPHLAIRLPALERLLMVDLGDNVTLNVRPHHMKELRAKALLLYSPNERTGADSDRDAAPERSCGGGAEGSEEASTSWAPDSKDGEAAVPLLGVEEQGQDASDREIVEIESNSIATSPSDKDAQLQHTIAASLGDAAMAASPRDKDMCDSTHADGYMDPAQDALISMDPTEDAEDFKDPAHDAFISMDPAHDAMGFIDPTCEAVGSTFGACHSSGQMKDEEDSTVPRGSAEAGDLLRTARGNICQSPTPEDIGQPLLIGQRDAQVEGWDEQGMATGDEAEIRATAGFGAGATADANLHAAADADVQATTDVCDAMGAATMSSAVRNEDASCSFVRPQLAEDAGLFGESSSHGSLQAETQTLFGPLDGPMSSEPTSEVEIEASEDDGAVIEPLEREQANVVSDQGGSSIVQNGRATQNNAVDDPEEARFARVFEPYQSSNLDISFWRADEAAIGQWRVKDVSVCIASNKSVPLDEDEMESVSRYAFGGQVLSATMGFVNENLGVTFL